MPQTPPPTDTPQAMPPVGDTWKDRILGPGAIEGGPLQRMLQKDNTRRTAEAQMHWDNVKKSAAILASGYDPDKKDANGNLLPLDDDGKARYQAQYNLSKKNYEKIAGVSKDHKNAVQKLWMLMDHAIHKGSGQQPQPDSTGGGPQAGPTPPPQAASVPGGAGGPTQVEESTPPRAAGGPTPPPNDNGLADAQLPAKYAAVEEQRSFDDFKRRQDVINDNKIDIEKIKAAAKVAGGASPAPRIISKASLGVLDARKNRDDMGETYTDENGEEIDLDKLQPNQILVPYLVRETVTEGKPQQWVKHYSVGDPNMKVVKIGGVEYSFAPQDIGKPGAQKELGPGVVSTTTKTKDPVTGLTATSVKTPGTPGMTGAGGASPTGAAPATGAAPTTPTTGKKPTQPPAGEGQTKIAKPKATATAPSGPELDETGHIPSGWKGKLPDGTPATGSVIEAANQLIDDKDVDKIPTKVRELGAQLARQFGWWQGKMTPADILRIKEATKFLHELQDSDALKVLDQSAWQRFKTGFAGSKPREGGITAQIQNYLHASASKGLTEQQAELNRRNDQLTGVVAGLSSLVRAGRATNSQVDSIRRELPNVFNAKDSKDAKGRIDQLLKEVDLVYEQGWKVGPKGTTGGKKGMTPPPSDGKPPLDSFWNNK